ncbi:MAG: hypothetical protein KAS32_01750 [Candidatus Peribacteraceae bacterium]|nr:hypothetical protein [Candidatus Peribacteraceae bacterium]
MDDLCDLNEEQLRRKADQHWEMTGLARQDHDMADVIKHTELAKEYEYELKSRS